MSEPTIHARTVESGEAGGQVFLLQQPLSFWGGFNAETGTAAETGHPDFGASLKGCVLLMERAKGSSSSSSVVAEALRNGTAPCAIVMREADLIVALGAIVARELYGIEMPIVVVDETSWGRLIVARHIHVKALADGTALLS